MSDFGYAALAGLGRQQARWRRFRARRRLRRSHELRLLVEGDSHERHPLEVDPPQWLRRLRPQWVVYSLAGAGHQLRTIASGRQQTVFRETVTWYRPRVVILAGGGNDLMGGGLPELLRGGDLDRDRLARRLRELRALCELTKVLHRARAPGG